MSAPASAQAWTCAMVAAASEVVGVGHGLHGDRRAAAHWDRAHHDPAGLAALDGAPGADGVERHGHLPRSGSRLHRDDPNRRPDRSADPTEPRSTTGPVDRARPPVRDRTAGATGAPFPHNIGDDPARHNAAAGAPAGRQSDAAPRARPGRGLRPDRGCRPGRGLRPDRGCRPGRGPRPGRGCRCGVRHRADRGGLPRRGRGGGLGDADHAGELGVGGKVGLGVAPGDRLGRQRHVRHHHGPLARRAEGPAADGEVDAPRVAGAQRRGRLGARHGEGLAGLHDLLQHHGAVGGAHPHPGGPHRDEHHLGARIGHDLHRLVGSGVGQG